MKYVVNLTVTVDTDDYDSVLDGADGVRSLVEDMIEGTVNWPAGKTVIDVNPVTAVTGRMSSMQPNVANSPQEDGR